MRTARTLALAPQGDVNVFAAGEVVAPAAVSQHRHHSIDDVVPGGNVKAPTCPSPGVVQYQKLIPEPSSIEEPSHEGVDRPHQCIGGCRRSTGGRDGSMSRSNQSPAGPIGAQPSILLAKRAARGTRLLSRVPPTAKSLGG